MRIERPDDPADLVQFQHSRTFWNEQTNAELNGRDIFNHALPLDHLQQIQVTIHRGPGREGHKCRMQGQAKFAERFDDTPKILAAVSLFEEAQYGIIHRFDRADHKSAAGIAKSGQVPLIFEQVFDLDGHIIGHVGKFAVKLLDEFHGMTNAIKKIRIAKSNVLRSRGHLPANVFEHDVAADDSKDSFVDRHDGAMPAKVLATAACFR